MTVSSIGVSAANNTTTTQPTNPLSKLQKQFLQLLITEMQNQDPTQPTDASSYMNQISQLYNLQQGSSQTESLNSILGVLQTNTVGASLSYLDKTVDINSNQAPVQNGKATWTYTAEGATSLSIVIKDATGNIVGTSQGDATPGSHTVTYNDTTHGSLFLYVVGQDSKGKDINATITAKALVDGVDTTSGQTVLTAGGVQFSPTDIARIKSTSSAS